MAIPQPQPQIHPAAEDLPLDALTLAAQTLRHAGGDGFRRTAKKPLVGIHLPKADMHVHIALALSEELFLRRIKDGRTDITADFLITRAGRYYETLGRHHSTYERMRHITQTQVELAQVTQDYLERIAREGCIYAELSNSFRDPDIFAAQMDAIEEGIRCARANTGIEARVVVTAIRNMGADHAATVARHLARAPRALVTGFGLVGEEDHDAFAAYAPALHIAWHEAGLGLAPHVAEQILNNAVDFLHSVPADALRPTANDPRRLRAGHATLIHMSDALMDAFATHGVCIETCLSANKRIGLPTATRKLAVDDRITGQDNAVTVNRPAMAYFGDIIQHPLRHFVARGIPVCLGSDNPLLMNTNIGKEYSLAVKAGLCAAEDTLRLTEHAIHHANLDAATRQNLQEKIATYRARQAQGTDAPQMTPLGYLRAYGAA